MAKKKTTKKKSTRRSGTRNETPATPDEQLAPPAVRFDQIIGHPQARGVLARAIQAQRVHHAWIFHGPKGVGKRTAALAFAGALLDPTTHLGPGGDPASDPDGPVAAALRARTHPDLHVITKELARYSDDRATREKKLSTIPKAVIEEHLIRRAGLAAQMPESNDALASKLFIVDEAELLDRSPTNAPVQNAILKTLEEPPAGTVIILVTSSEDRLLPTIRSRCQRVAFGRLSSAEMDAWLQHDAEIQQEWDARSPQARSWLLAFAEGSPGALLEAIRSGLDAWHDALREPLSRAIAGEITVTLGKSMTELVSTRAESIAKADKNASKTVANAECAGQMFRLVAGLARQRLASASSSGDRAAARAAASAIDSVETARRRLGSNVSLQLVFEGLSADLSSPAR